MPHPKTEGCCCRACMGKKPLPEYMNSVDYPPMGDYRWKKVGDHWEESTGQILERLLSDSHSTEPYYMRITIIDLLTVELSRRLTNYTKEVNLGNMDKATANMRYMCLETAAYMAGGEKPHPSHIQPWDDVQNEIETWMATIQRESSAATMYDDARLIAVLSEFIAEHKPKSIMEQGGVQARLL